MLRLTRTFSLDHIISTLPKDQQERYNANQDSPTAPFRMGIVGQEKDGLVLVVRDIIDEDGQRRSCVDSYDIQTREHMTLYRHETAARIVSASVNVDKTLLSFTTLTRYRTDRKSSTSGDSGANYDYEEIYESCLVEIQPQSKCYSLNIRSREHQRIQFLNTSEHGQSGRGSVGYTNFLFFLDREFIHLYLITTQRRADASGVRIIAQPHLHAVVQKLYLWYHWDTLRGSLYVLIPPRTSVSPGPATQKMPGNEHLLRCLMFPGIKRGELVFEVPLPIQSPKPLKDIGTASDVAASAYSLLSQPLAIGASLTIIRMRGNALLLCQQHPPTPSHDIHVTIFALHQNGQLDFEIPLHSEEAAKTRVAFLSWGDILLVFVPGYHLQVVDIGPEHEASESLILGPEFATTLPDQKAGGLIIPFDVRLPPTTDWPAPGKPDLRGHCLLDCRQGTVYEFSLDREALFRLLTEHATANMHVKGLHLAIVHMQDQELVDQVLATLCSSQGTDADYEVFNEFLVGTTYHEFRVKFESTAGVAKSRVLSLLPISTLLPYEDSDIGQWKYGRITSIPHVLPGTGAVSSFRRFAFQGVNVVEEVPSPQPQPQTGGRAAIRGWFGKFFGAEEDININDGVAQDELAEENEGTATPGVLGRKRLSLMLSEYLSACLKKDPKANVIRYANDYVAQQMFQSTRLFNFILADMAGPSDNHRVFRLMEQLYWAIEELSFPLPRGFHAQFAALGLQCLTHSVFLQYVNRGIIRVTEEFIKVLTDHRDDDDTFFYSLVTRLKSIESAVNVLRQDPNARRAILENSLQCASYGRDAFAPLFGAAYELTALPVSPEVLDQQLHDGSWESSAASGEMVPWNEATSGPMPEFIPLSLFLNSLLMAVSESDFSGSSLTPADVAFLNEHAKHIALFPKM